jgi:hypothetical protein
LTKQSLRPIGRGRPWIGSGGSGWASAWAGASGSRAGAAGRSLPVDGGAVRASVGARPSPRGVSPVAPRRTHHRHSIAPVAAAVTAAEITSTVHQSFGAITISRMIVLCSATSSAVGKWTLSVTGCSSSALNRASSSVAIRCRDRSAASGASSSPGGARSASTACSPIVAWRATDAALADGTTLAFSSTWSVKIASRRVRVSASHAASKSSYSGSTAGSVEGLGSIVRCRLTVGFSATARAASRSGSASPRRWARLGSSSCAAWASRIGSDIARPWVASSAASETGLRGRLSRPSGVWRSVPSFVRLLVSTPRERSSPSTGSASRSSSSGSIATSAVAVSAAGSSTCSRTRLVLLRANDPVSDCLPGATPVASEVCPWRW